jgi:hypothetical protein
MFFGPYVIKDFSYYVSIWSLGGALFLHQYFWRPLTWIVIGDTFMAGFADRETRQQARQKNFNKRYMSLLISNMLVAIPFTLVLSLFFHNWLTRATSLLDLGTWLIYWLFFFEMFFFVNPLVVMYDTRHPVLEGIGLRFSEGPPILRANIFFLLVSGILYIMFFSSALVSYAFLGITLQTADLGISQLYWLFTLLVLGDCFIDPFMIGYRLLLTRLYCKGNR